LHDLRLERFDDQNVHAMRGKGPVQDPRRRTPAPFDNCK
jgi:hypothetical protein